MKMKKEGNENGVKVTMRWKLLNQDAKRGTQKKEGENTDTWNLAQSGQTLERQGKRKAKADGHGTRPAGGGRGRKRLNQPDTAKPTPTSAREGPNLPVEGRTHEIRDPWGTS